MELEIKPTYRFSINFKELWTFKELVYFFTWRDIKIKYKQTVLGIAWAVLQPLMLMTLFTLFFSHALKMPNGGLRYPVFVYSGLMFWNIFSNGISSASNSMVNNSNIIKKIYFPRLIIPISSITSSLVDFIISFILFIGLLIIMPVPLSITSTLIALPLCLIATLLTTFGLGCFFAALNVKYRDFRYVIPFMLQVLLFLTPVIYPISIIPYPWLQSILELNPMSGAIDFFRSALSGEPLPWVLIIKSLSISFFFLVVGVFYFRKTEYYFADLA